MSFESSNTKSLAPIVDHELGQSRIHSPDASPKRSVTSESSNTKSSLDRASTPAEPERPRSKHIFGSQGDGIYSFVFLHDNVHVVSGSWDGKMRKWDCETGLHVGEPWEGGSGEIRALALSPNGNLIACGRYNGSVQQWNTDGKMINEVWMGHKIRLLSLSWSPNGDHIASGLSDGTMLIRNAENGEVQVGPIETGQRWVRSLAYSPSGDRIASGGHNGTICIWDSNTGKLLVGPINDLGESVTSVMWSSDGSKLYSASDYFARVFNSVSGTELHRFEHNHFLYSTALSSKHNLLACVGSGGIAQLWDTESYQPLGKPFSPEDSVRLECVSFSRDGRYLAYGGRNDKITLWMIKDIAPELLSSSSFLEVDATNPFMRPGSDIEDGHDNPYGSFFESLEPSHAYGSSRPSQLRNLLSPRHLWNVLIPSRRGPLANQSIPPQPRINRDFFLRYTGPQPVPVRFLGNHPTSTGLSYRRRHTTSPEAVEVPVARGFQRLVARKRKHKTKSKAPAPHGSASSMAATSSQAVSSPMPHASVSSQAGASSQDGPAQAAMSSQPAGGSPSHVLETHDTGDDSDSDSDSSIQGSWNKFLVTLCFPRGRYYDDRH